MLDDFQLSYTESDKACRELNFSLFLVRKKFKKVRKSSMQNLKIKNHTKRRSKLTLPGQRDQNRMLAQLISRRAVVHAEIDQFGVMDFQQMPSHWVRIGRFRFDQLHAVLILRLDRLVVSSPEHLRFRYGLHNALQRNLFAFQTVLIWRANHSWSTCGGEREKSNPINVLCKHTGFKNDFHQ